jgi:hypothetical protein
MEDLLGQPGQRQSRSTLPGVSPVVAGEEDSPSAEKRRRTECDRLLPREEGNRPLRRRVTCGIDPAPVSACVVAPHDPRAEEQAEDPIPGWGGDVACILLVVREDDQTPGDAAVVRPIDAATACEHEPVERSPKVEPADVPFSGQAPDVVAEVHPGTNCPCRAAVGGDIKGLRLGSRTWLAAAGNEPMQLVDEARAGGMVPTAARRREALPGLPPITGAIDRAT